MLFYGSRAEAALAGGGVWHRPRRTDQATQHKLNAIADGLADLMEHLAAQSPDSSLDEDMKELRAAIGLETREGTSSNAK